VTLTLTDFIQIKLLEKGYTWSSTDVCDKFGVFIFKYSKDLLPMFRTKRKQILRNGLQGKK
jgi:hypothetical protein